jgi:hypothetical protein
MQLLQLYWEDQNRLLFKFQKDQEDMERLLPDNIKSMNIKFELLKVHDRAPNIIQEPFLLSIKDFHFSANIIAFSIELDKLNDIENLKIKIIRLTIFYYSGEREEIFINRSFQLSEILYDDGESLEIMEEEVVYETKTRYSYKKKTSVNKKSNSKEQSQSRNRIQKTSSTRNIIKSKSGATNQTKKNITISESEYHKWLELKGEKTWDTTLYMVRKGFGELSELKTENKELTSAIKQIALNKSSAPANPVYLQAPLGTPGSPAHLNPPPGTKSPPSVNKKYSLSETNTTKVFRGEKDPKSMNVQIEIMREMKEKFESVGDVKELLSKVPEGEKSKPRAKTDHLGFLEFKQKKSEKERAKQIKKLKKLGYDEKVEELSFEELEDKIALLVAKEQHKKKKEK